MRLRPHVKRRGFFQHDRRPLSGEFHRALSGRPGRDQIAHLAVGDVRERANDQTGGDEVFLPAEHKRDARAAV